jgi:alpha-tubulin suppressor-like RCC1 family protein
LDVAAAELSYYVLRSDNTLWSWGWNGEGELGLGDNTDRALPTQIAGSWESISVGAYSLLAIKTDNTLWGAGYNTSGMLGVGDTADKNSMTQVTGTGWDKVSTAIGYGDHTLAVKTNGTLWAWGSNTWGQLGIGSSGSAQLTPVQVGSDTNWSYVHAGYDRSFALKTNGTLWSWGSNLSTALGQGDSNPVAVYTTPTQVGADTNWTKLSSGWAFTFALKSNGTLWVTGTNVSYGLGVGSTNTSLEYNTFTQVGSATDWADISCGYEQCVARKTDGSIYTWGYNADGELGLGDTTNRASPTQVGSATDWTDISGGFYDALAVKNNVLTYWGWNFNDYLGTGNEPELSPVSLPYSSNILY